MAAAWSSGSVCALAPFAAFAPFAALAPFAAPAPAAAAITSRRISAIAPAIVERIVEPIIERNLDRDIAISFLYRSIPAPHGGPAVPTRPSDLVLGVRVELHGAGDVAFRVVEEDQVPDRRDE